MSETQEYPVVWLQCAGCSGCSVSLLNSTAITARQLVLDQIVPGKHVNLRFHPTIMAASGEMAVEVMLGAKEEAGYLLVVEGSIPVAEGGHFGGIGEKDGKHISMADAVADLAAESLAVVAIGSCSSFGGIPATSPNPTGAASAMQLLADRGIDKPVVNIPGCPPHPDWFVGTVARIMLGGLPAAEELDELGRPLGYYGKLIHESCPRRADFEAGRFAKNLGEDGCMYELGCKGPMTNADCPTRLWNDGTNWCVGANSPCHGCVEPEFVDGYGPMYEKVTEARLGRFRVTKG
jgi:hydrogenase small subunit